MSSYLFNKIENSNICVIIQNVTMLIPDLLNILFDQANHATLNQMRCLNKRRTKYANKYSVLSHHDMKSVNFDDVCKKGLIKTVIHIVSHGEVFIDRALFHSAENGHVLVVKYLANVVGANIHARGECALRYSAENGHLTVVKYLVSIGANIHADDDHALKYSAKYGKTSVVTYLVSIGANIRADNDFALRWSAYFGHFEVVKYLVCVGANIHAENDCALRWSAEEGHLEVVKYLIGAGANVHAGYDYALQWSTYRGHLEVVKYLVSVGADINVNNGVLFGVEMIRNNFGHLRST